MDNDDWYMTTYLEHVNNWLNKDKNIVFSASHNVIGLDNGKDSVIMKKEYAEWNGPTMCFSNKNSIIP